MNNTKKSLIAILICYFSWGLFPIYFKLLKSIDAYEVLAMRVLCSFIFMILVVLLAKNKNSISLEIKKIWQNKKSFSLLVLASFLITANWLTYIIAVNTNHVLEASFGYYLNPIVTIILAVVFLKEKLTRIQTIACICVGISLLYLFISIGSLPWISILLALTFGLYSLCKKKIILSPKAGLLIETAIVSPIAIIYMLYLASTSNITFYTSNNATIIALLLSGAITAIPLMLFAKGAVDIPLYLLGILQYLPPTMQFFVGIFIYNEPLSIEKLISFIIIWIAVAVFCYSAVTSMKKHNLANKSHQR
ncbi:EamA family transporter RarD [Gemella morbillorum]|jgi:protein rarD|uniref:EamA family transporter RarD n=1 Tax=Gemella morbillorum TaxID=29391 RepID=UPI00254A6613|nr:EamA family transporter RarD [Gemella morbillorum]MDK8239320.1 EamA family transporter RarD [Gemella morbillorum]MDK8254710.1 EamA family transporter RarD [Gemella morbillorum]